MLIITLIIYGSTIEVIAWKPLPLWTDQFGDANMSNGVQGLTYVNGTVYASGFFNYSLHFIGSGNSFLREYRSDGDVLWTSHIGNFIGVGTVELSVSSEGIYIIRTDLTNSSVQGYDFKGNQLWSIPLDHGISETSLSAWGQRLYVAGYSQQQLTNQTIDAAFVREYDLHGSILWTKSYNLSRIFENPIGVQGVSANSYGVFVLLSNSLLAFSPNGKLLWSHELGGHAYVIGADSTGVYVSGTVSDIDYAGHLFLEKFAFDGDTIWNDTFDSPIALPFSLSAGSSGVYLSLTNSPNNYLLRYDLAGNLLWTLQVPLKSSGDSGFIVAAGQSGPYLAGATDGNGGSTALVQSFSSSSSLFFFGVSPPWSFALLASPFAALILIVYFVRKHYRRIRSTRSGPPPPYRFRMAGNSPG